MIDAGVIAAVVASLSVPRAIIVSIGAAGYFFFWRSNMHR